MKMSLSFTRAVGNFMTQFAKSSVAYASTAAKADIDKMVKSNKVVVFMKGVPEEPKCGFSNAVVQVLRMHGVNAYSAVNVLENEDIRQGIKDYSNWPTIPQVFINGEFIGGCDIILQMHKNGDLIDELKKVGITSALLEQSKAEGKQES